MASGRISGHSVLSITTTGQTLPADTMTDATGEITVPITGLYLIMFCVYGMDQTAKRALQVWDANDNVVIGSFKGYVNSVITIKTLTSGMKLRGKILEESGGIIYTDSARNFLTLVKLS